MPEWFNPERGYYVAKYRGRQLEIIRNPDPTEKRRYVAKVDGVAWPNPCHTLPQCKTKAMKWADNPGLYSPDHAELECDTDAMSPDELADGEYGPVTNGAVVPYVEPGVPALKGGDVRIAFTIDGSLPVSGNFSNAISNLQAAVDMLREEGAKLTCTIEPPPKVSL